MRRLLVTECLPLSFAHGRIYSSMQSKQKVKCTQLWRVDQHGDLDEAARETLPSALRVGHTGVDGAAARNCQWPGHPAELMAIAHNSDTSPRTGRRHRTQ